MARTLPGRFAAACLLALCASAIACGDALAPGDVAGTYALQRVESDPLPTLLFATEYVRVRVLADTVRLNADGSGIQISVLESEPLVKGIAPEGPARGEVPLRFETVNGRIEVTFICPPNANCAPPPHLVARAVSEGLRVEVAAGYRLPLLYARVPVVD